VLQTTPRCRGRDGDASLSSTLLKASSALRPTRRTRRVALVDQNKSAGHTVFVSVETATTRSWLKTFARRSAHAEVIEFYRMRRRRLHAARRHRDMQSYDVFYKKIITRCR